MIFLGEEMLQYLFGNVRNFREFFGIFWDFLHEILGS